MPRADYYLRQNDAGYKILITCLDNDGNPVNLTGATAEFHMDTIGGTSTVDAAAAVESPATAGVVSYTWLAVDTDTPGLYLAEVEVTYSGGAKQTFPNDRNMLIKVLAELA